MNKLIPALMCLFLFSQCKKDSKVTLTGDFQPLTVGSNWTYLSNGNTVKLTVTNKDTVALGRTYKVLSSSDGANQYQARSGNEHYRFATFQGVLPDGVEELFLRTDKDVNGTWQFNVQLMLGSVPFNITAKYTILEKEITKMVQGTNYTGVVHVRQDLTSPFGNNGGGDFYYAKGIGLISSDLTITFPGQSISNTSELISYEIK